MKTQIKLGLILLLAIFLGLILFSDKVNPNLGPLFQFKRLQEKFYLSLRNSPETKLDYQKTLLNNRAQELRYLVETKNYRYILTSSLRYSATAGNITNLIADAGLKDRIDEVQT